MSKPVIISADSTCDLSPELRERYGVKVLPLTITLGEESFPDDGRFTSEHLYARYRADGTLPQTSAPNLQEFLDFYSPYIEQGCEVVHLSISEELSLTATNARVAAQEFPRGSFYPVDSRVLSTGVGLLAIEGAEKRDEGWSAAEIAAHLEKLTEKVETSFVLDTLEFMAKGGRCSNFAALGANLLKLKPALEMHGGELGVYKKYRGNIESVYKQYIAERLSGGKRVRNVFLTESGGIDKATLAELEAQIRKAVPGVKELHHAVAGCTVSTHCGPKTMGVIFLTE